MSQILSFLLKCADLSERGFGTDSVVAALTISNEEEQLPFLEACAQLTQMGFKKEQVFEAVAASSNDAIKAIDFLESQTV